MKKIITILLLLTTAACAQTKKQKEASLKYIDFELPILNSTESFKLSNIIGKKLILLNFWTTWCPYCVKEIPDLKALYEKYNEKGLEIVAINIGEPQQEVSKFVKAKEVGYMIVLDKKGQVARNYGVRGIPTNFLVGINGEIIFAGHSLPEEKIIEDNLPKQPTTKTEKLKKEKR